MARSLTAMGLGFANSSPISAIAIQLRSTGSVVTRNRLTHRPESKGFWRAAVASARAVGNRPQGSARQRSKAAIMDRPKEEVGVEEGREQQQSKPEHPEGRVVLPPLNNHTTEEQAADEPKETVGKMGRLKQVGHGDNVRVRDGEGRFHEAVVSANRDPADDDCYKVWIPSHNGKFTVSKPPQFRISEETVEVDREDIKKLSRKDVINYFRKNIPPGPLPPIPEKPEGPPRRDVTDPKLKEDDSSPHKSGSITPENSTTRADGSSQSILNGGSTSSMADSPPREEQAAGKHAEQGSLPERVQIMGEEKLRREMKEEKHPNAKPATKGAGDKKKAGKESRRQGLPSLFSSCWSSRGRRAPVAPAPAAAPVAPAAVRVAPTAVSLRARGVLLPCAQEQEVLSPCRPSDFGRRVESEVEDTFTPVVPKN